MLQATNRPSEAEPLLRRALTIDEQRLGVEHPKVAIRLNNLATLLQDMNQLVEAEPLLRRALAIDVQTCGPELTDVAVILNNLGRLLQATNRLVEAEPLLRRARIRALPAISRSSFSRLAATSTPSPSGTLPASFNTAFEPYS